MMPMLAFAQAVLPTSWGFTTPSVSAPPTGWGYNVGTNGNLTYAFGKNDALSGRLDATGENITINFADKPGTLTYYLSPQNAGNAWAGQFDIQESDNGTTWTTMRSFTSKATTATNFNDPMYTDSLKSTTRWVRFYYTIKLPGGSGGGGNMAVDLITVNAAPAAAVGLLVKQNTTTLSNGITYTFGNSASKNFTIQNVGTGANLKIDSIVLSGTHAADFAVGTFDSITPFNNGTDTFSVYFTPSANGSRYATVKLYTSDTERSPFLINLYAIGGQYATEPAAVPSINVSNVRTQTLTVSYPSTQTEKYLILRKVGGALTEAPVDGVTYQRGDYIGGAQVMYIGADTTAIKPNYILANTNYSFAAYSVNGPAGFENYNTSNVPTSSVTTLNGEPGNYYNGIDPQANNFLTALHNKINSHDTIFYSSYLSVIVNNYLSRDTTGGKKAVTCVYTGAPYVYNEPFTWWTGQSGNPGTQTREHTFCQSWMPTRSISTWPNGANGKELPEYNDLHHLFPADQLVGNGKRSNYPLAVVVNATYTSPTGEGKLGTDSKGNTVYEPRNEQKGDAARALLYMLTCYDGANGNAWRLPSSQDLNVLLQWHQQDPPSALEIARNEYIYTVQKNRNPFIDHPEWTRKIDFSTMTYIAVDTVVDINITAPAPNAMLNADSTYSIVWNSNMVDSVVLQYVYFDSSSSAIIVTPIVGAIKNNNIYSFKVPNMSKNNVVIYVREFNAAKAPQMRAYDSVMVNFKQYVGLTENSTINHLVNMYPVPSTGVVNIALPAALKVLGVDVYDITGKLVEQTTSTQLNLTQKGMYIVKVITNGGVATKRVIIE